MIIGVGLDIIEVERFARKMGVQGDLSGEIFTSPEIAYCRRKRYPGQHFAARFCAKEALFKALGSGKRGKMSWRDIEILNETQGLPRVTLRGATKARYQRLGVEKIHVSLSHTRHMAAACVILESTKN
jgi:holo-[acyl-carrier protein] synthase